MPSRAGIFASARVAPSGGGGATFQGSAYDETDGTSWTFTAQPIGAASASRRVVVAVGFRSLAGRSISSVTIGGVAATIDATVTSSASSGGINVTTIASAVVTSGTTADVVVTVTGGSAIRCMIGVWTLEGSPTGQTDTTTVYPVALTVTTSPGDVVIAATVVNDTASVTWTGVTGRFTEGSTSTTRTHGADGVAVGSSTNVGASKGSSSTEWDSACAAAYA